MSYASYGGYTAGGSSYGYSYGPSYLPTLPAPAKPTSNTVVDPATGKTTYSGDDGAARRAANAPAAAPKVTLDPAAATTTAVSQTIKQISPVSDSMKYGVFNPPAHALTRSYSANMAREQGYISAKSKKLTRVDQAADKAYEQILSRDSGRLGYIYQDPETNLNTGQSVTNNSGKKIRTNGQVGKWCVKQLWGFQFHYNPTSISQSLTNDPTMDWSLQGDQANALTGTSTLTFQLYLNRIVDMAVLSPNKAVTKNYPRKLEAFDVDGILQRGTNYDLDFLFRTVNGDPVANSPMLDYADGMTSDFGYLTGIPVWFNLGPNQRYKGSIVSVNITHVMFSPTMVPVLTTVDLTVARYPVISYDAESTANRASAASSYLGSNKAADPAASTDGKATP